MEDNLYKESVNNMENVDNATHKNWHETIKTAINSELDTLVAKLLDKATSAPTIDDKIRITSKVAGVLHVMKNYGEQLNQMSSDADMRKIINQIHTDFSAEPSDDIARGMDAAGVIIYSHFN
jgi:hypothetical protein